ncbi:beta-ketoacyl-[acyl-carrier-protein] synthase family protein [Myxococcota bacterium]|nr:beta-ketoacyl-[acyl-carrier-protein] synthase family protein [Myxococcota bacterium]
MHRVAVTGLGVVSAAGIGLPAMRAALAAGDDVSSPLGCYSDRGITIARAMRCADPGPADPGTCRADRVARPALEEALAAIPDPVRRGSALFLGGASAFLQEAEEEYLAAPVAGRGPADAASFARRAPGASADSLAGAAGMAGPRVAVATACSSGLNALGAAFRAVRAGRVPAAVAGGVEVLGWLTCVGFRSLGVLGAGPLRPFDAHRDGIVLGEAAAFLVLEREEDARARGAEVLGYVRGWACLGEGWHPTQPEPTGACAARVMGLALRDAGLRPDDLGWIKAHGNGSPSSDLAEARGVERLLGRGADAVPVTSMKGLLGHTLAASGAVEAVAVLDCLREGRLPPTWGLSTPDPEWRLDHHPPGSAPRAARGPALINAFAFGGNDASVVVEGA